MKLNKEQNLARAVHELAYFRANIESWLPDIKLDQFTQDVKMQNYILGYIEEAQRLIDSGDIVDSVKMDTPDWKDYNFRGGVHSLVGLISEVWFAVRWNRMNTTTTCILSPSKKSDQMKGIDLLFRNDSWSKDYAGQSKTIHIKEGVFNFYPQWFDKKVHRLVLTDYEMNTGFCMDFYKAQQLFLTQKDAKMSISLLSSNADDLKLTVLQ